jgi:hypothetical protein
VRAPPHSLSGSLFGMSWTERDLKEKCVRAIHKRVRDVVALFFVANDNVLGNAWFPYIDTLALRPERRQTAALETLVMKSFERFNMERVVTDNGRMVPVVLFPNLALPDGGTLAVAYEVELRTNIDGAQVQRWRRLRILDLPPAGRSSRRGGGSESSTPPFVTMWRDGNNIATALSTDTGPRLI